MLARVNGVFRPTEAHVRVLNTFMKVKNIHVRVGNAWRPVWAYTWKTGNWGGCSASCGGGTQTRTVTCTRNDGRAMPDAFCADAGTKPAASQPCNTHPCYTYDWQTGSWGDCSIPCGGGERYRTVTCRRNDGLTVSDSYCSGSKPVTSQYCNNGTCGWYTGGWSGWSTACGQASRKQTVYCEAPNGSQAADTYCRGSRPASIEYSVQCTGTACLSTSYVESVYLGNKLKQAQSKLTWSEAAICRSFGFDTPDYTSSWTTSTVVESIKCAGLGTPLAHFLGNKEGVCGHSTATCCKEQGMTWY